MAKNQTPLENEVISGSLTLSDLYIFEAFDGVLHYSLVDQSLLSASKESVEYELEKDEILISMRRTTLGRSYCIERSTDLKHWEPEPNTEIVSSGTPITWELDASLTGPLFHRIKEMN